MISLNLLPDSKMERLRAQQRQRRIGALSVVAIAIGVGLPIILIVLWGGQKALLRIVQGNIDKKAAQLRDTEGLQDQLTVQHQMATLPGLESQRLFYTTFTNLLPKLLPQNSGLNNIEISEDGSLVLQGTAGSIATINDFVGIMVQTRLVQEGNSQDLFHEVILRQVQPTEKGIAFEVVARFEGVLLAKTLPGEIRVGDKVLIPFAQAEAGDTSQPLDSGNTLESQ